MGNKTYLSDGVYISNDGMYLVLEADENIIYLNATGIDALLRYIEKSRGITIEIKQKSSIGSGGKES